MNIILYPMHVSFCQQFARDETINVNFGIFPSGGGGGVPGCLDPSLEPEYEYN